MSSVSRLQNSFVEALNIDPSTNFDSLTYGSIAEWDSVAHVQLVNAIEREFDVMLDTDQVLGMSSFQRAKEILIEHGINFDD